MKQRGEAMTWGDGLDRFRDLVGDELGVDRTGHEAGVDEAAATNGYDLWTWEGREQRELDVLALRWEACAQAGAIPLDALQRDWHAKAQRLELELEGGARQQRRPRGGSGLARRTPDAARRTGSAHPRVGGFAGTERTRDRVLKQRGVKR